MILVENMSGKKGEGHDTIEGKPVTVEDEREREREREWERERFITVR